MSKKESAAVYFEQAKKATDLRHKKYLLEKALELMPPEESDVASMKSRPAPAQEASK
jgi:hypothetical protein